MVINSKNIVLLDVNIFMDNINCYSSRNIDILNSYYIISIRLAPLCNYRVV